MNRPLLGEGIPWRRGLMTLGLWLLGFQVIGDQAGALRRGLGGQRNGLAGAEITTRPPVPPCFERRRRSSIVCSPALPRQCGMRSAAGPRYSRAGRPSADRCRAPAPDGRRAAAWPLAEASPRGRDASTAVRGCRTPSHHTVSPFEFRVAGTAVRAGSRHRAGEMTSLLNGQAVKGPALLDQA